MSITDDDSPTVRLSKKKKPVEAMPAQGNDSAARRLERSVVEMPPTPVMTNRYSDFASLLTALKAVGTPLGYASPPQPNVPPPKAPVAQTLPFSNDDASPPQRKKVLKHKKKSRGRTKCFFVPKEQTNTTANAPTEPFIPSSPTAPIAAHTVRDEPMLFPENEAMPPVSPAWDNRIEEEWPRPGSSPTPAQVFQESIFLAPSTIRHDPVLRAPVETIPPVTLGRSSRIGIESSYSRLSSAPVQVIRRVIQKGKSIHLAVPGMIGLAVIVLVVLLAGFWSWQSAAPTDADPLPDLSSKALPDTNSSQAVSSPEPPMESASIFNPEQQELEAGFGPALMSIPSLPTNQQGRHNRNSPTQSGEAAPLSPLPLPVPSSPASPPVSLPKWEQTSAPQPAKPEPVQPEPVKTATPKPVKMATFEPAEPIAPIPISQKKADPPASRPPPQRTAPPPPPPKTTAKTPAPVETARRIEISNASSIPSPEVAYSSHSDIPSWLNQMRKELSSCWMYSCRKKVRDRYCTGQRKTLPDCMGE